MPPWWYVCAIEQNATFLSGHLGSYNGEVGQPFGYPSQSLKVSTNIPFSLKIHQGQVNIN